MIVDAQFIYTGGPYTEFRGYVFAHGKPAHIRDGATLEALLHRPDFRRINDAVPVEEIKRENTPEEALAEQREILHVPAKRGWPLGRSRK